MTLLSTVARKRPAELEGRYDLRGSYQMSIPTGAITVIAAGTTTAGHLFSFRWGSTTATKAFIKYIGAKFIATTAYTTAQETAVDLFIARGYTASHSAATAVDTGGTITSTGELMTSQAVSLVTSCRVASTVALTAGTHTLDANPLSSLNGFTGAVGDTIPRSTSGSFDGYGALFNARRDESPIVLSQDEGFVLINGPVMGAVGVGKWRFLVQWDEGTPS